MTDRRDLLDPGVAVRQPARPDPRREYPARLTPLASSTRAARDPDVPASTAPTNTPPAGGTPETILVKSGVRRVATRVAEILYVEAARNYVHIHLESGTVLKSRVQIERLAEHLGRERFLRIHRGRLVNLERIRSVRPIVGGRLQLTLVQGSTIIVARDRRRVVLAEIGAAAERRSRLS